MGSQASCTRSCHSACCSVEHSEGPGAGSGLWRRTCCISGVGVETGNTGERSLCFLGENTLSMEGALKMGSVEQQDCEQDERHIQLRGSCRRAGWQRQIRSWTNRPTTCFRNTLLEVERNLAKGPRSKRQRQHLSEVCRDWMEERVKVCTLS